MKATLDRIIVLSVAAGMVIAAHFFKDQAASLIGLAGLLTGYQIPYGNTTPKA